MSDHRTALNQKNRNQQISYLSRKLFDRRPRGPLNEYFNAINTEFCFKIDNRMKVSKELAGPDFCCVCVDKRFFVVCVDKRVQ